jgi:serine/threonine-protein kinase
MDPDDEPAEPPTFRTPELEDTRTLPPTQSSNDLPARAGAIVADDPTTVAGAYALGELLGRGGMGEVVVAHDRRIGRDVALKRILSPSPSSDDIARFLREARIQARLEHPAIVPVYELARDSVGRPYFTMKRLGGATLASALADRSQTQQRMLRAFAEVCRAIDLAHSRGVVHRDLKPSNIGLGEFGEVYVLDWGIARVLDDANEVVADADTLEGTAPAAHVVGTPGYAAPEQLIDAAVGRAADVYALGAILFELLAGEPLHGRAPGEAIRSTLAPPVLSPLARRPDRAVAPELDALCVAMLARSPSARPTAHECAERVDDYLDGDRDLERRRAIAAELLARARAPSLDPAEALHLAGRALALDPDSREVAALVTKLMLSPPRDTPPALEARLKDLDRDYSRRSTRVAIFTLLSFFGFIPVMLWAGLESPLEAVVVWSFIGALVLFIRRFGGAGGPALYPILVGLMLVAGITARLFGPFILTPALIGLVAMGTMAQPDLIRRPVLVIALGLAAFFAPLALQGLGVLASTWSVSDGAIVSTSAILHIGGAPTIVMLVASSAATIVIIGLFSRALAAARRDAQREVAIHAWRLEQLVPGASS